MPDADAVFLSAQGARQALGHVYRSVAASRAADPDREIALALLLVSRQQVFEEFYQTGEERPGLRVLLDVGRHGRILARLRLQLGHEMGVREETDVEQQVEIVGGA